MQVRVLYTGLLRRYIGIKEESLELPEGATVDSLIATVAEVYRDRFPTNFLPAGRNQFTELIRATHRGGAACGQNEVLAEDDEILLISRLAGG